MLGWIEKVVPQPPVISSMPGVVEEAAKPESQAKETNPGQQKPPEGNSSHTAGGSEKKEDVVTPDPAMTAESSGQRVLTWLSQGLGKVMPHPLQHASDPLQDISVPQTGVKTSDACNQTESINMVEEHRPACSVTEITAPSGREEEPHPSSDNNAPEKTGTRKVFTRLMEGFEKMIPHPESVKKTEEAAREDHKEDQSNTKGSDKELPQKGSSPPKHRASADSHSGISVSLFSPTLVGDGGSIFTRFMHGLEKAIPQPVSKEKQDGQSVEDGGLDSGQARSKGA